MTSPENAPGSARDSRPVAAPCRWGYKTIFFIPVFAASLPMERRWYGRRQGENGTRVTEHSAPGRFRSRIHQGHAPQESTPWANSGACSGNVRREAPTLQNACPSRQEARDRGFTARRRKWARSKPPAPPIMMICRRSLGRSPLRCAGAKYVRTPGKTFTTRAQRARSGLSAGARFIGFPPQ